MSRRAAAALLGAALGACSHASSARAPSEKGGAVKIALKPIASAPELEGNAAPAIFEQSLCSALFELNDREVVCPGDAQAFMKVQRDTSLLGGQGASLEEANGILAAPRSLALSASKKDGRVVIGGLLIGSEGKPLGRFETRVAADGEDADARARELAAEVVAVP